MSVWRVPLVTALALVQSLALARPAGASLADDIARLRAEVIQERSDIDPLAQPWMRDHDVTLDIAGPFLVESIRRLEALPPAFKRTDLSVPQYQGQLWGWEADCRIWDPTCNWFQGCWRVYGKEGAYVEFNDPNYTFQAAATLSNLAGTWLPGQGLRLDLHAALEVKVGTLKGNRYFCPPAGSYGGLGGPANGNASGDLSAIATFGSFDANGLAYSLNPGVDNIQYGLRINMGSVLPDLGVDGTFPGVHTNLDGRLGVPLSLSGEIVVPTGSSDIHKTYKFELGGPAVLPTSRAIRAQTNVIVHWF